MQTRLLNETDGLRTFAVVFSTGEEPVARLKEFAREHGIVAGQLVAIGAFEKVTLGYFEWQKKDYERITFDEQVEVLTFIGNIALKGEEPALHAHVALGRRDGTACGGHLLEATVRPTLEVIVTDSAKHLRRRMDEATGLPLIDLSSD